MTTFEISVLVGLLLLILKKTNHGSEINAIGGRLDELDRKLAEIRTSTAYLEMADYNLKVCAEAAQNQIFDYNERNRDPMDPR